MCYCIVVFGGGTINRMQLVGLPYSSVERREGRAYLKSKTDKLIRERAFKGAEGNIHRGISFVHKSSIIFGFAPRGENAYKNDSSRSVTRAFYGTVSGQCNRGDRQNQ